MQKILVLISLTFSAFALNSCMGGGVHPVGLLYADVSDPVAVTSAAGSRTGQATATSYLGLIATGDSSIAAAKANGHITNVSSVDVHRKNILGIISKYTTVVKGN